MSAFIQNGHIRYGDPVSAAQKLSAAQFRHEQKLAAFIERNTDEAIAETLAKNEEILSELKTAVLNDDMQGWTKAMEKLFLEVRQYVHKYA